MRIALFVEGSPPAGSKTDHCKALWNVTLLPALGCRPADIIVPFGKDAIARMCGLRTSTSAPGLDTKIAATRKEHQLDPERDAIVVAWDIEPIDPGQRRCAWDEKRDIYRGIASSPLLQDTAWARDAAARHALLQSRKDQPPTGQSHAKLRPGAVLGLCMEPMFEALLARDGRAIRRALGLASDPPDWPTGWGTFERDPSKRLLARAIDSMRRLRPRPEVRRTIRENWQNAKDEWGDYLLRKLLADPVQSTAIREHPISARLRHIMPTVQ